MNLEKLVLLIFLFRFVSADEHNHIVSRKLHQIMWQWFLFGDNGNILLYLSNRLERHCVTQSVYCIFPWNSLGLPIFMNLNEEIMLFSTFDSSQLVRGSWGGSAVGEHTASERKSTGNICLLFITVLHRPKDDNWPLPRNSQWSIAGYWTRIQRICNVFQR